MDVRAVVPDAVLDATLLNGLERLAQMIATSLAAYGLRRSTHLPPEAVSVTANSGPQAIHLLADEDIVSEEEDACSVTLHIPVLSYYILGPATGKKAPLYSAGLGWVIPIWRAHFLNWSLDGFAWKCEPQRSRFIGLKSWGKEDWTALRVRSLLDLVLDVEKEW